jgi:hypothetical protein
MAEVRDESSGQCKRCNVVKPSWSQNEPSGGDALLAT